MQLYSVEQKRSQALEAHAAAFSTIKASCPCMLGKALAHSCRTNKSGQLMAIQSVFNAA